MAGELNEEDITRAFWGMFEASFSCMCGSNVHFLAIELVPGKEYSTTLQIDLRITSVRAISA
jgi:hypothetical protein